MARNLNPIPLADLLDAIDEDERREREAIRWERRGNKAALVLDDGDRCVPLHAIQMEG